jgi:thioredoxin-related protein
MKKLKITTIVALFIIVRANGQGIKFAENMTWKEIQKTAKAQNKYIFMDTYATWCQPCKVMRSEIFPQKKVGDLINDKFISVMVQMDKTPYDDEYMKDWALEALLINRQYNITVYPTMLFFSPDGRLVHKAVGYKDALQLIEEARKAVNPETQYYSLLEQYHNRDMDTSQMKALVYQATALDEKKVARKIASDYVSQLNEKALFNKENLSFIGRFLTGSEDNSFNLFVKKAKKINSIVQKNFAENIVLGIIYREEIAPFDQADKPNWISIEKKVTLKYRKLGQERVWGNMTAYYNSKGDWANFGKYYKKYFDQAIPNGRSFLHINNLSWPVVEHVNDRKVIEAAIKTMKFDIDNYSQSNFYAFDTYANLLYKAGRRKEAIRWEQKAVKLSNNGEELVNTLEKMRRGDEIYPIK